MSVEQFVYIYWKSDTCALEKLTLYKRIHHRKPAFPEAAGVSSLDPSRNIYRCPHIPRILPPASPSIKGDVSVLCLTFPVWLLFGIFRYEHRYSYIVPETCRVSPGCRHWAAILLMTTLCCLQTSEIPRLGQRMLFSTFRNVSLGFMTTHGIAGSKKIPVFIYEGYG